MLPPTGFSRPAIERSVVVLPQPLGPSSVNSLPSGTSNVTSWAAFTLAPFGPLYSVNRPCTFSMSIAPGRLARFETHQSVDPANAAEPALPGRWRCPLEG